MKTKHSRIALAWLATTLLFTACGGGDGTSPGASYTLSGQVQKGPFAIGSQISVNELDNTLNPTGKVYNVQTTDNLGNFAVSSQIATNLVEIVGSGFYMDELTGQLASSQIQIRAVADLSVNTKPTVNVLTAIQAQRLKILLAQGQTYSAADTQSQTEVLAAFGIDSAKVNSLSNLYSMQINGSTDADAALLATSVILIKMAANAAGANGTTQPAELSNYINTIAEEIADTGTITDPAFITARNLAETQINLAAVRTNLETYYANHGVTMVAPKFEEWIDLSSSGTLPQRLVPVAGLTFTNVVNASPGQLITSNPITVAGVGAGNVVPVTVSAGTTIIKNSAAVSGTVSTAQDGDVIAMRVTSLGYGLTNSSTISVGSSSAVWNVASQPLGGTISGLTSTGLVLQNNGGDNITIPAGSSSFTFPAPVSNGASYNVSILTLPTSPLQDCVVTNGIGTVGTAVSSISVVCSTTTELAYVSNSSGKVLAYGINVNTGALISIGIVASETTGIYPLVIDPTGTFAYGFNILLQVSPGDVLAYSINKTSGALTRVGTVAAGVGPSSMVIEPGGKFAYVANFYSNDVSAYSINATTGALTSIGTVATGTNPSSMVIDPAGKFAYVANSTSSDVSAYSVNVTTGALTSIGTTATGVSNPAYITVDPTSKSVYVVNNAPANSVSAYSINATTGALTSIGTVAAGAGPRSMAIDPTGKFAYVVNNIADTVSAYSINATTGALTSIGTVAAGIEPVSIVIDPAGKFAYVANSTSSDVSAYSINATTGALTSIGTVATGAGTRFIAIMQAL